MSSLETPLLVKIGALLLTGAILAVYVIGLVNAPGDHATASDPGVTPAEVGLGGYHERVSSLEARERSR